MLSTIIPIDNYECDYKLGSKNLNKGVEYVINTNWAKTLNLNPTPFEIPNYNSSIDLTNKKLLIIRAMGAGDLLFLSPSIKYIKEKYPTCQIGIACIKEQHGIANMIPGVDETLDYPMEKNKFDEYDHYLQVAEVIEGNPENKDKNIYSAYFEIVTTENIDSNNFRPIIKTDLFNGFETKRNVIGIHPFANDPIRSLNSNIIFELYKKLKRKGFWPIIIGTENEFNRYHQLKKCKWSFKEFPTYKDTVKLISQCEFVISSDSLITHLAQAIGTETICIYGPFPSKSRVSEYKNIHIIDSNPECRCYMHQLGHCRRGLPEPVCLRFDIGSIIDIVERNNIFIAEPTTVSTPEIEFYGMTNE